MGIAARAPVSSIISAMPPLEAMEARDSLSLADDAAPEDVAVTPPVSAGCVEVTRAVAGLSSRLSSVSSSASTIDGDVQCLAGESIRGEFPSLACFFTGGGSQRLREPTEPPAGFGERLEKLCSQPGLNIIGEETEYGPWEERNEERFDGDIPRFRSVTTSEKATELRRFSSCSGGNGKAVAGGDDEAWRKLHGL